GAPSEAAAPGSGPALPSDVSATVQLTVDALVYRRQVVRQVLISMSLDNGQLRVSQALALLPGGSDVSVTGVVAPVKSAAGPALRFTGRFEAGSDNLRGMLQWLGVDIASVPPGRLRRMSLSTNIDASASQAILSDIDLRIDVSRATGGIAVALRKRPGFGIGLAIDKLNLDAYLPSEGAGDIAGQAGQAGDTGQGTVAATAGRDDQAAGGPFAALAGFDANLDFSLGSLSLRGVTARNLKLDATLQQGSVTIREFEIGDLAGSTARLSGMLLDLATTPSISAEVALSVPNPAKLARLAGLEPAALARIGALELTGTVQGTLEQAGLDAKLTALGGSFGAAGTIQPLSNPMSFDVKLVAKHPDLTELARALDVGPELGPGLGGLDLTLGLRGTPVQFQVAGVAGKLGPVALTGGFAADLSGPTPVLSGIDMGVAIVHSDLGALIQALSPGTAVPQGLGAVDLAGRLTGGATAFQIADLAGRLGPADLSGRLGVDLAGAKPALDIDLTTGELPLAALMAAGGGTAGNAGATGGTTGSGTGGGRWSRDPIDVSGLNAFNAEVKLNARALLLEKTRIDRVTVEASLVDGLLDLRKFNGTVYDGALAISGKVDARKTLEVGLAVTAIELNLARLLHDLAESDRVSGPLSLNASLSTRGRSEADLIAALTGNGKLDGTLKVKAKQGERVGGQLLGIAGALLGQKIKEFDPVRGLTLATNVLFNAFADAPAAVTGNFTVERGVVVTDDLRVDGQKAVALTQARADLPRWLL
ncbi:MAG: AsmA family protein, partial [Kiloniellales bacterium]